MITISHHWTKIKSTFGEDKDLISSGWISTEKRNICTWPCAYNCREKKAKSKTQRLLLQASHGSHGIQPRGEMDEGVFFARDGKAAHWMIKPELFLRQVQQVLKSRMIQVRNGNHKSLLLVPSHVHCTMPFGHGGLVSAQKRRQLQNLLGGQTNTHRSKMGGKILG